MQFGHCRIPHKWLLSNPKKSSAAQRTINSTPGLRSAAFADRSLFAQFEKLLVVFRQNLKHPTSAVNVLDTWPTDDLSSLTAASAISGTLLNGGHMPFEEAEALVKQWQEIKAEALGPDHQIQTLSEILDGSMLFKVRLLF